MGVPSSILRIASDRLGAAIATLGAEMQDLRDAEGRLLQWSGDAAVWSGHAPLLFPIIGELANGRYRHAGRTYAMGRHGIARKATFAVIDHAADRAHLRLVPDDAMRAAYPFSFRLDVVHRIDGPTLTTTATVTNEGDETMPASLGFHPGFAWPLPYGRPRDGHAITFEHDEPAPIRRLDADGLVMAAAGASPVVGDTLVLRDEDFDADALVFDRLVSRRVGYGAADGPRLVVRFDGMPMLGVWTKPGGAHFICIEPWHGMADEAGFDGELADKPGMVAIAPGTSHAFGMAIELADD